MDGIAGIVYHDVFQVTNLINPMLSAMAHRGRNIQDICTIKNVQLGICGHHIVKNPQKTVYVGIDGTIYNHESLKKELMITTQSTRPPDITETLATAYEKWGCDLFAKIRGDFAIMIYDQQSETLFLVRDRIGKKPLYWYQNQHHFIFASELKAILATGAVPQTIARDAIAAYLYFGYIPQDMSPIKEVNKLLPAHYLEYSSNGSKVIQSYWSYSSFFEDRIDASLATCEHLDHLLSDAVKRRIDHSQQKDPTPLGCFISGGVGSATIAYYLSQLSPHHSLNAFSVGFSGENDEDIKAAQTVATSLHIPMQSEIITPQNLFDSFVKVAWHLDEPLADPNVMATWHLALLSRAHTHAVFSGMGCDELLAGHSRYTLGETLKPSWWKTISQRSFFYKIFLLPLIKLIYKPAAYGLIKREKTNPWQFEYVKQNALFDEKQLRRIAPKLSRLFDPEVFLNKFQNLFQFKSMVAAYQYFDVKTQLVDCFLLQYERLTAAHGLDWYTPFLDQNIVEYLATLHEPSSSFKSILKNMFPSVFIHRPKENRPQFLQSWLAQSELSTPFQMLPQGLLVENGLISKEWLQQQLLKPLQKHTSFRALWSILALEVWYRLYIHQSLPLSAPEISLKELLQQK